MGLQRLDRWLDFLTGPHLLLGIVWLGMVCVTITLLLMMVTRWGQSQPLKKCVILSLLTHALLATYATTIEIVGATPAEPVIHTTLVEAEPPSTAETDSTTSADQAITKPWEGFSTNSPQPEQINLDREPAEQEAKPLDEQHATPALLPAEMSAAQPTEATEPDPRSLAEDNAAAPTEAAEQETLEAPTATRRDVRDPLLVERSAPAKPDTPKNAGPPNLSSSSPGLPGELTDVPTLPRMVELPAVKPGPLAPALAN
ncbi:MAG: hypothetical protein ACREHD_09840, partial [Pirellulales bacterium]